MDWKVIGAIIVFIFTIPTLVGLIICSSSNDLDCYAKLLSKAAVPWWVGILSFLASIKGLIGGIIVIAFVLFLMKSKSL